MSSSSLPLITSISVPGRGPTSPRIVIVGESPGEQDVKTLRPFSGSSGSLLRAMLKDAGINPDECYYTLVFKNRPSGGRLENFLGKKAEVGGKEYSLPPLAPGKYFRPEVLHHVDDLKAELLALKPNIVVALGNTACWALLGSGKIASVRGTIAESSLIPGLKVLPTFHPGMIFKAWHNRPLVVTDLAKALRESSFPEIRRISREVWLEPTLEDIKKFFDTHISPLAHTDSPLSFDIETKGNSIITCIGFAPSSTRAIVIPFYDGTKPNGAYWPTPHQEASVWRIIKHILESSAIAKLAQNGLYDIQYLWKKAGIQTRNYLHDTMLAHHAQYLELQKGLGFLGSVYCNEASWKTMRTKVETNNKRDE